MKLWNCIIGIVMLAGAIWLTGVTAIGIAQNAVSALPDFNFIPVIDQLIAAHRYAEAGTLAHDVVSRRLPGAAIAAQRQQQCEAVLNSVTARLHRGAAAFVTGTPGESTDGAVGAILADLCIYGDLRDLAMQSYYRLTGHPTDPIIVALSGAGLATELLTIADWLPAVLKTLRKTAALSPKLTTQLSHAFRSGSRLATPNPAALRILGDFSATIRAAGPIRSRTVLAHVNDARELHAVAAVTVRAPSTPFLLVKSGGAAAIPLLHSAADSNTALRLLSRAAGKGPPGIRMLKKIKWSAHLAKTVYHGRLGALLTRLAAESSAARRILAIGAFMLFITGIILTRPLWRRLFPWLTGIFRRSGPPTQNVR